MDLDEAVAAVTDRRTAWRAGGLTVGPVTWRDAAAPWPQRLETDRAEVTDPDSIGIHVRGPHEAELLVVLYRGGWADIDYLASIDDAGVLPTPAMTSTQQFGALLDTCMTRVFGLAPAGGQGPPKRGSPAPRSAGTTCGRSSSMRPSPRYRDPTVPIMTGCS
ncbi:hypothetical protein OHU34_36070 [Streptomyces sp. NBC_00080]|uniref:hypothetical protein n=1 Tax=Streptomyces sp. NBC_00080 TaxID=2975645 RepID=UPI003244DBE8